jgi:hypothetical protein
MPVNSVDPLPGVMQAVMHLIVAMKRDQQNRVSSQDGYEMRVFGRSFDLISAFEELEHLVELLGRTKTFQEISLLIKLYIIGWVTLSDVVANILNDVFDLGYAEQDVQFGVILRNRKIQRSPIPAIVKQNAKFIRYEWFAKRRNDIIHRGRLDDSDLAAVRGVVLSAVLGQVLKVDTNDIAAVEAASNQAAAEVGATQRMADLIGHKQQQFAEHLLATRKMFGQLAPLLVERINAQTREAA